MNLFRHRPSASSRAGLRLFALRGQVWLAACVLLCLIGPGAHAARNAEGGRSAHARPGKAASKPLAIPDSSRLVYRLQPGESHRYKITAIFTGHFPPWSAQPGSPPVNLKAQLEYVATVKKRNAKGVVVEFVVDDAEASLLEKDPGPSGKVKPDEETPFPLPLSQVQSKLNVTATLQPDGTVTDISGGDTLPIPVNLGFDLRKLFLLVMPVTFPDKSLKVDETWAFEDGILGHKPGKITYTGRLQAIHPQAKRLAFQIGQRAEAIIDEAKDKNGNPTDKPADAIATTRGKVTVNGSLQFVAVPGKLPSASDVAAGRLLEGHMVLNAQLAQRRTVPDPAHPENPLKSDIDVRARLFVRADDSPQKRKPAMTSAEARETSYARSAPAHAGKGKDKTN